MKLWLLVRIFNYCHLRQVRCLDAYRQRRNRDQAVLEGKQHQLGIALQIERLHDVVLVEFDRLWAQVQLIGDLLHGIALREQLGNIALPGR